MLCDGDTTFFQFVEINLFRISEENGEELKNKGEEEKTGVSGALKNAADSVVGGAKNVADKVTGLFKSSGEKTKEQVETSTGGTVDEKKSSEEPRVTGETGRY